MQLFRAACQILDKIAKTVQGFPNFFNFNQRQKVFLSIWNTNNQQMSRVELSEFVSTLCERH